jgi:ribosomal protein S18 acetylase RimI-like enzyme
VQLPIRTYRQDDLEALVDFMNSNHEFDKFSEALLQEKLTGDPHWDDQKALICHDDGKILGFMQGVIRDIRGTRFGYIKLMAVKNGFRRQGVARAMFQLLESRFRDERVEIIRIYDVPLNYFMPGIDPRYTPAVCFAMAMGFQRFGDTLNMNVNLMSADWETHQEEHGLKKLGIVIGRPLPEQLDEVLHFVGTDWQLWEHEVRVAFNDDPPAVHVAWLNGKIKAFSAYNGNNKGTGWFGPMGTHPDLRGKGIGSILLKRCLADMKTLGHKSAIIPWVDPIAFYAHYAEARIERVFWRYEKIIDYEN